MGDTHITPGGGGAAGGGGAIHPGLIGSSISKDNPAIGVQDLAGLVGAVGYVGFADRTKSAVTLLTPTSVGLADLSGGAGYVVYVAGGVKLTIKGALTCVFVPPSGFSAWALYLDAAGTLRAVDMAEAGPDLAKQALTAYVLHNAECEPKAWLIDKRQSLALTLGARDLWEARGAEAVGGSIVFTGDDTVPSDTNHKNLKPSSGAAYLADCEYVSGAAARRHIVFYRKTPLAWYWALSDFPFIAATGQALQYCPSGSGPEPVAMGKFATYLLALTGVSQNQTPDYNPAFVWFMPEAAHSGVDAALKVDFTETNVPDSPIFDTWRVTSAVTWEVGAFSVEGRCRIVRVITAADGEHAHDKQYALLDHTHEFSSLDLGKL